MEAPRVRVFPYPKSLILTYIDIYGNILPLKDILMHHPKIPVVYETETEFSHQMGRYNNPEFNAIAESNRARIDRTRAILGRKGIDLVAISASDQPSDLSYETGKFITISRKTDQEIEGELAAGIPDLRLIPTLNIWSNGFDTSKQSLPFVLKDPKAQRGERKLLLSTQDQISKLDSWRQKYQEGVPHFLRELSTQPYIETPGGVSSSYRVVVTATGRVISAGITYAPRVPDRKIESLPDNISGSWLDMIDLVDPNSPLFLGSQEFRSNVATGGLFIPLDTTETRVPQTVLDSDAADVLGAHGIVDSTLPLELESWSEKIGQLVGPSTALILGVDFIQDLDGNYYMLEVNAIPGTESMKATWGMDRSASNDEVYDRLYGIIAQDLTLLSGK